jgi:HNH endonuclease/NUMOD4 motif
MAAWKTVACDSAYEVSDEGFVRSVDRVIERRGKPARLKGKELKLLAHSQGYWSVCLSNQKRHLVHSLVMEAFVGPRKKGMDINHKNGDKKDNRLENLEYCSRSQNMAHAVRTGLMPPPPNKRGASQHLARLNEADVRGIRQWHKEGGGVAQMARFFDVGESTVRNIIKRNSWAWLD